MFQFLSSLLDNLFFHTSQTLLPEYFTFHPSLYFFSQPYEQKRVADKRLPHQLKKCYRKDKFETTLKKQKKTALNKAVLKKRGLLGL